jgi:GTP-binding protein
MINFFALNDHYRLVDLPGYGYAKAPRTVQERWENTVDLYLQKRRCLKGLVIIMDIRHPLKEMDEAMIEWAVKCKVPTHILLSKADKLTPSAAKKTLQEVEKALSHYGDKISLQLFSSLDRTGLDEAKTVLDSWFCTS